MAVNNMVIQCSDELMKKIEDHCFSETQIEVGGFLVGTIVGDTTTVTNVMRAKKTVGKSTNLTFTHDTWTELYKEIEELKTESVIIGWYHSHPNFGVFLSEHDKFIQNNYFKADGQITTVVDPIRGRRGWWYSSDEKIVTYGKEVDTTKERLGKSATDPDANMDAVFEAAAPKGGVSTGKVIAISAAMSLLSFLGGWGVSALNAGNATANQAAIQVLNQKVLELQKEAGLYINPATDVADQISGSGVTKKPTPTPTKTATSGNTNSGNATSGNSTSGNSTSGNSTSGNSTSGNSTSGNSTSGNSTSGSAPVVGKVCPTPKETSGKLICAKLGDSYKWTSNVDYKAKYLAACDTLGKEGKESTTGKVTWICSLDKKGAKVWQTAEEKRAVENAPKLGAPCSKLKSTGTANDGTKLTCGKSAKTTKWMTSEEYAKSKETESPPPPNNGATNE
jgi:proteasome lid subunit RPN8/RPN11